MLWFGRVQSAVNQHWHTCRGKADVFSKGNEAQISAVGECALNVVQINLFSPIASNSERFNGRLICPFTQDCTSIRTALFTKDSKNQYWVCGHEI